MTITPQRGASPTRTPRGRNRRRAVGRPPLGVHPKHAADPALAPAPLPTTLPALPRTHRRPGALRAYLNAALLRCVLYLAPISVGVAGGASLRQVAWPVPLVTLLLGWTAAQALTCAGAAMARRAGPAAACRLVGAGFAAVTGLWCALVWIAPDHLLGPHRGMALVVGLGGLATLATVTAALVTRAEAAVVRWSLPCWVLAAATLVEIAGKPVPWLPVGTLLPAAIVLVLVRSFRPAMLPGTPRRRFALSRTELRQAGGYLVIGLSQAICVVVLWRGGPSGSTVPFWLPLLLAVPILEALIAWNIGEAGTKPRGVTLGTLAGLLPPLTLGCALAVAGFTGTQLPGAIEAAGVLPLAGGTLLGGVFAITFLLAARGRTGIAATIAAAPPLVVIVLKLLPVPAAGALPNAVGALAVTHAAGLLVVALTAADHRRDS
ncbi:hypothetical protein [Paractinoplanes durhamensis]|uniref:Integral membrane protein n=1 Tax=Paractinoplanes durhamensis TaxID=113563 RepID=A0ABQ3YMZ7_9ACTN|nr:hypothetical protein [Actinoplanes durhamensis]GID98953.1 hypothetical protein Adu01nite_03040 [Actinoplanes durhamensis]